MIMIRKITFRQDLTLAPAFGTDNGTTANRVTSSHVGQGKCRATIAAELSSNQGVQSLVRID